MRFLLGAPCAGKGTIGNQLIKNDPKIVVISAGNLLREMAETPKYSHLKPILNSGGLVAVDVICNMLIEKASEYDYNVIIDGFPRTVDQALFIKNFLDKNSIICEGIFVIKAPKEVLEQRTLNRTFCLNCQSTSTINNDLLCCEAEMIKRADDNLETLEKRLSIFENNIDKILEIMEGPVYFIDNNRYINDVYNSILNYF